MKKRSAILGGVAIVALLLVGAGCEEAPKSTYRKEADKVSEDQKRLAATTPIPTVTKSQERENIVARAKVFDVQNKVGYVYLVNYGRVMSFYTIRGKVSSLNSFVTPLDRLARWNGSPCDRLDASGSCYVVSAPDIDGAYGENADGIFFFTTDGAYVEWKGDYLYADQPLRLTTQPELVREIK